jgi:CRISPR-associated protein Cas2
MWVLVFFDLPTESKADKRNHALFRKNLKKGGFTLFQLSIYLRNCPSREAADTQVNYVKRHLPEFGKVVIAMITDKQFGQMEVFNGRKPAPNPPVQQQLELF